MLNFYNSYDSDYVTRVHSNGEKTFSFKRAKEEVVNKDGKKGLKTVSLCKFYEDGDVLMG